MTELELLRTYEPIFRYTAGEMFFPAAVDGYLEHASLWKRAKSDETGSWSAVLVAESGKVTAETLPQYTVTGPSDHAPGRLARVGLISRISAAPSTVRQGRVAELWAAASTGFFLLMGVFLLATNVTVPIVAIGLVLATVLLVENILTGHLERLLLNVTIVLAVPGSLVLIYEYFWQISVPAIAALAILLIVDNFREVSGR
jgi:hypothetical protein